MRVPSLTIGPMTSHAAHTLDIDAWVRSIPRKVPDRSDCSVGRWGRHSHSRQWPRPLCSLGLPAILPKSAGIWNRLPPATPTVAPVRAQERVAVRSILRALVDFQRPPTRNAKCRRIPPPTKGLAPGAGRKGGAAAHRPQRGRHPLQQSAHCTCAPGGGPWVLVAEHDAAMLPQAPSHGVRWFHEVSKCRSTGT